MIWEGILNHRPELTFACELAAGALQEFFAQERLIPRLKALNARVSLGILDLSPERAEVVRQLNAAEVPVIAWLLLPEEQGYWLNLDNAVHTVRRYQDFREWSILNRLQWAGIGLDIEPDIRIMKNLVKNPIQGMGELAARYFHNQRGRKGREIYQDLVKIIHQDGFFIESYQFPFIVDERIAGSTLLQRLTGVVDLEVDQEVLLLYTSFMRGYGPGLVWSYGRDSQAIGVGSTGGGVEIEGIIDIPPLNWEELRRDLLLAAGVTRRIFIFSLEGCNRQGFLELLISLDWDDRIISPARVGYRVSRYRRMLQFFLWFTDRPWWKWLLVIGLAGMFLRLRKQK